jgi:hypothetical protein
VKTVVEAVKNNQNSYKRHFVIAKILNMIERVTMNHIKKKVFCVPSHTGIKGNKKADELAQKAIEHPNEDLVLHFSEIPSTRKAACSEKRQIQWNNSEKLRVTFSNLPQIVETPWYKSTDFDRSQIVFWNQIIANHTRCKNSLHRFKSI